MREYATPATFGVPATGNLTSDVLACVERAPDTVLFRRRSDREGAWDDVTAARFRDEVVAVARGLLAAGIGAGERVGLWAHTRYEWTLVDYACWWVGAVTVPVYGSASTDQLVDVLADSGAVACVVETAEQEAVLRNRPGRVPALRHVWALDDRGIAEVTALGAAVGDLAVEARRAAVTPDDLATIIYTPGTTGAPKGCCLTHGNFMVELGEATAALPELFDHPDSCTLLFLPLAHVYARVVQVGCVRRGTPLGHTSDTPDLTATLRSFRPTFVLAVPRFFERFFDTAAQQARESGRARVFDAAAGAAVAYSRSLDAGGPGLLLRLRHRAYDRLVYARLRASLGGRVRHMIVGGGPLGERLSHFFRGIGVPVLEGYGLTESTGALSVNLPAEHKVGTVGRPLPGTTVRVADDAELLVRGGQVFAGYWGDASAREATASALAGGWLHTGDVGEIDAEGFVRVTGRKHEILVTAGGKKVAPAVLEDLIRLHPVVGQCLVVGDGRPYVAALITLDPHGAADWAGRNGRRPEAEELYDDPDLLAELQQAVDQANTSVSQAESVRRFEVLPVAWTEEAGYLTPTLKLKRAQVLADFRSEVEALYD